MHSWTKILNLFKDLLDTISTDKTLKSKSEKYKNENENDKTMSWNEDNENENETMNQTTAIKLNN